MNKISVFEHPEFGRIRTLDIDGKISTGCRRKAL